VVVVEAAPKSGSLITARRAGDYGREVMAVPGSPLDPRAQGCNLLIREGATLVQNAEDVIEAITPMGGRIVRQPSPDYAGPDSSADADSAARRTISDLLGPTPVQVDELIRQSGISPAIVHTILLELELAGRIERHAGGKVSLA
jgi:DNA processing protein